MQDEVAYIKDVADPRELNHDGYGKERKQGVTSCPNFVLAEADVGTRITELVNVYDPGCHTSMARINLEFRHIKLK